MSERSRMRFSNAGRVKEEHWDIGDGNVAMIKCTGIFMIET